MNKPVDHETLDIHFCELPDCAQNIITILFKSVFLQLFTYIKSIILFNVKYLYIMWFVKSTKVPAKY